jgi:hypothetical protein
MSQVLGQVNNYTAGTLGGLEYSAKGFTTLNRLVEVLQGVIGRFCRRSLGWHLSVLQTFRSDYSLCVNQLWLWAAEGYEVTLGTLRVDSINVELTY